MGKRREGREAAVQFLFASELHGEHTPEEQAEFWTVHSAKTSVRSYAESLVKGVQDNREAIDAQIAEVLENFRIQRLAAVDRNILRLAVYELMHVPDVPGPVIINEAIEIAKALGAGESGSFVNGILHKIGQKIRPK